MFEDYLIVFRKVFFILKRQPGKLWSRRQNKLGSGSSRHFAFPLTLGLPLPWRMFGRFTPTRLHPPQYMPGGTPEAQFANLTVQLQRVLAAFRMTLFQMLEIRMQNRSGIWSRRALRETIGVTPI